MKERLPLDRPAGEGWLALLGGGEFSFGETLEADRAWLEKAALGPVGFLPAASGSVDYGQHFSTYLQETFSREVEVLPVYRVRDGRRSKNADRAGSLAAVYLGGGVTDHLLEALADTPVVEALLASLRQGGTMVAIAAAAQALGVAARSLFGGKMIPGLRWLPSGVVEPNFDPGHDRRLRQLMEQPGVAWGLGIPAGSAVLLGPGEVTEVVGTAFLLEDTDGDFRVLGEEDPIADA